MARILRGDIWWAQLDPVRGREQAGTCPVLIVSQDVFNERSGTVIAMAITSEEPAAGYPLTYRLADGTLPKSSWVKISQVRTLATERLSDWTGRVDAIALEDIIDGLNEIIGH